MGCREYPLDAPRLLAGVGLSGRVKPGPTIIHLQMESNSDERTALLVEEVVRSMMDKLPNLSPHLVTHPLALAALGLVTVLGLAFIGAPWYAYALVCLILVAAFAAVIKYPHLRMEGSYLYKYASVFSDFRSDAVQAEVETEGAGGGEGLDALRVAEYERTRGLFLVHSWRPSKDRSQVVDLVIRLQEHRDTSTRPSVFEEGKVESVRYELGRRFFEEPVLKRNRRADFALEVSAYRPVLCLAEVRFKDDHDSVHLSRYIDFPNDL